MPTTVGSAFVAFIHVMLFTSNDVTAGGSVCAGRLCNGGQCVSRTTFCDGRCDCVDCSDENIQTCQLYNDPEGGGSGDRPSLGSGAIVGIVVAAICVLLLIIAILIIFLICRIRREARKNLRSRRGPLDNTPAAASSGCALPVDIPIEALARQPPPQYTPRVATATPGGPGGGEFNISILPPPYYAPGASAITEFSCAYEAPPKYQSSNDLSKPSAPPPLPDDGKIEVAASRESVDRRRTSVDSFVDEPSMSNILLTSSRSSGLGFDSRQPSSVSCSSLHLNSYPPPRHSTGSSGSTSPVHLSSLTTTDRSQSLSDMYHGSMEIPGREIRKTAGKERSVLPTRSVPCLHGIQGRTAPGRSTVETSAEHPKQGKYRKKMSDERCSEDSGGDRTAAAAAAAGGRVRLHDPASSASWALSSSSAATAAAHGLSTRRRISRSLPQLTILQEEDQPWREMESCDV